MLVYQQWVTRWLLNHGSSFFFQSDKDKLYLACMSVAYMSSEESEDIAVSEWHEDNSSSSDEDLRNMENLCARPLSWQSMGLMV